MRNLALTTAVLLIAVSFAQANLITDGSFEGNAPTVLSGLPNNSEWYWQGVTDVSISTQQKYEGDVSLRAQNALSTNRFYYAFQFIDSSSMGPGDFDISGWMWKRYSTVGVMYLRVYGWEGSPVISESSGSPAGGTYDTLLDWNRSDFGYNLGDRWVETAQSFSTTKTYDRIEVQLGLGSLRNSGYSFWDDVSMTYTPEPTTMGLLGVGGLALLRRKRQ